MSDNYRIVIVDDHPMVRKGVRDTLEEEPDLKVVGEGSSADDAVRLAGDLGPDLMLIDITMPGDGLMAAQAISRAHPQIKLAMLSVREDLGAVTTALHAGARGYISKGIGGPELVALVRRLLDGHSYVSPDLAARLLAEGRGVESKASAANAPPPPLTQRESEILELIGQGRSNGEIAAELGLSENTIKHYITPLLHKLGVRNRIEAAILVRKSPGGR